MRQYLDLALLVLEQGERREDRTGHGTLSLFGEALRFDLRDGFPAVTTKRLAFRQVAAELACFLRGYNTLDEFHSLGCTIWDANAKARAWLESPRRRDSGDLGFIYGAAWRRWPSGAPYPSGGTVDQLADALDLLRADPWTRRAVVSAWDPARPDGACLPPCHVLFQLSARLRGQAGGADRWELDCAVTMRSVDVMLGMPFDIASYGLLVHLCARALGFEPGALTMWFGDCHVYLNHLDAVREQVRREPRPLPRLRLDPAATPNDFRPEMAALDGYDPHPPIRAEMNA